MMVTPSHCQLGLSLVLVASLVGMVGVAMAQSDTEAAAQVIATERAALDRWGKGDPSGFMELAAPEITYFDPEREKRLDGKAAFHDLLEPIRGKIKIDRYELIDPKVQIHGDVALLTFNLANYARRPDGAEAPGSRWNSTEVYARIEGGWRLIHSHWSLTKPAGSQGVDLQ